MRSYHHASLWIFLLLAGSCFCQGCRIISTVSLVRLVKEIYCYCYTKTNDAARMSSKIAFFISDYFWLSLKNYDLDWGLFARYDYINSRLVISLSSVLFMSLSSALYFINMTDSRFWWSSNRRSVRLNRIRDSEVYARLLLISFTISSDLLSFISPNFACFC